MSFRILYHPLVSEDIRLINPDVQRRVERALSTRLSQAPQAYGKPLAANLAGYWKLRVGDYRVVFKIKKDEIWVLGIIHRKDVYSDVLKRLRWYPA